MAFEFLRSVGHDEITAVIVVFAAVVPQSAPLNLSGIVLLGQIGYFFELLLGVATVAIGIVGVFRCSSWRSRDSATARLDEQCNPPDGEPPAGSEGASAQNVEIAIRLEDGFLRALHRHRCVVTIHGPTGSIQSAEREIWYAREGK